MKYTILGDVHGNIEHCYRVYRDVQRRNPGSEVIQIGDLGVGFSTHGFPDTADYRLPALFKFFPGNHDNRKECHKLPNCLGDYGEYKDLFFLSGAWSIDKNQRIPGVSWWDDEELSHTQLEDAVEKWKNSKAEILLSHEGPHSVVSTVWPWISGYDKTRCALDEMIKIRKPSQVIFGHHHKALDTMIDNVRYICLDCDQFLDINTYEGIQTPR